MMRDNAARGFELVIGAGIAALLTIAALIFAGRAIGPAEYADFSAALAVLYLVTLAMSPVVPTVARVAARSVANDRIAAAFSLRRSMLRGASVAIVLIAIVGIAAVPPLAHWLRFRSAATLWWAIAGTLAYVLMSVERGFLQGLLRFREYNVNTIVEAAIRAIVIFLFLRSVAVASFAMAAWAAGSVVALLMVIVSLERAARRHPKEATDWSEFYVLLRPMILLMIALAVFQNTDVLAVKRFLTADEAGAYGAASALSRGFGVLFVPLYALAGPLLTHAYERRENVAAATWKLSSAYAGLALIPLLIVALWHEHIVTLLYGTAYARAGDVLLPLCGVTVVTYFALMLSQGLITTGEYGFTWIYIVAAVAQIAGLAVAHGSFRQILQVLYLCQGATLLLVTIIFLNSQKIRRDGNSSNSA